MTTIHRIPATANISFLSERRPPTSKCFANRESQITRPENEGISVSNRSLLQRPWKVESKLRDIATVSSHPLFFCARNNGWEGAAKSLRAVRGTAELKYLIGRSRGCDACANAPTDIRRTTEQSFLIKKSQDETTKKNRSLMSNVAHLRPDYVRRCDDFFSLVSFSPKSICSQTAF